MDEIAESLRTKSDKIRALTKAGYQRQAIADYLGIRYQHVRNVQVQSGLDANSRVLPQTGRGASSSAVAAPVKLTVDAAGRIVIPAAFRRLMGAQEGAELLARVIDGELRVIASAMAVQRAQKLVRELIPGDDSLADSLIADRRREAAKDAGIG